MHCYWNLLTEIDKVLHKKHFWTTKIKSEKTLYEQPKRPESQAWQVRVKTVFLPPFNEEKWKSNDKYLYFWDIWDKVDTWINSILSPEQWMSFKTNKQCTELKYSMRIVWDL